MRSCNTYNNTSSVLVHVIAHSAPADSALVHTSLAGGDVLGVAGPADADVVDGLDAELVDGVRPQPEHGVLVLVDVRYLLVVVVMVLVLVLDCVLVDRVGVARVPRQLHRRVSDLRDLQVTRRVRQRWR